MSFIDRFARAGGALLALLAGCSSSSSPSSAPAEDVAPVTLAAAAAAPRVRLPAAGPARSWAEFRVQAAQRLVAANPETTYTGPVVEPLLGIPVLEVELNADGSVRKIVFLRHAQEAKDTSQLAADAVRRAAPFGDVSRLPKPWRYTETFLFNHERKFKPRTLDQ
ncbi:MAG TPA: hypothetical protein VNU71_02135 [Burkholderiaceae bacterium]|nr:hypothetical protein [Burkholderiaceae bacterium]